MTRIFSNVNNRVREIDKHLERWGIINRRKVSILICLICLLSCEKNNGIVLKPDNDYFVEKYGVDNIEFDAYRISMDQLEEIINMDEAIVMVSRIDCQWCKKAIEEISKIVASDYNSEYDIYILETDLLDDVSKDELLRNHSIEFVPTFLLIREGKVVEQIVGSNDSSTIEYILNNNTE